MQAAFKTAGYTPKLPTFYPYQFTHVHATEGPGKTNPPTKIQNVTIYMGDGVHILVEDVFNAKDSDLSSHGSKTQLGNGMAAYYFRDSGHSMLFWNDKDGNSYTLDSIVPSAKNKQTGTAPDLNEQQLIKEQIRFNRAMAGQKNFRPNSNDRMGRFVRKRSSN
ncbi:hypothetical protein NZD89_06960 [Alicyclobacillus fastidiosus]|uniref:Uncharacterized protein n=1 Tax=Alicyclobacillus fastidiosus TaxID=392011 RepID=A0ABY6ZKX3_9BACL|nr:hypothetical protein [Alicyclobacillus fastidiosus]WAH43132.1 hypothetical protein NZD89_06960 [Alicyclobacillus fastidiosus]GMA65142.1 hypothetical protein GCM10025859_55820 [Alicyclobacillus fastidiosus]